MNIISVDGVTVYSWRVFDFWKEIFRAGITTRNGGYSTGEFSGLNLGHLTGDNDASILLNRQAAGAALGAPEAPWAVANQVHKTRIGVVKDIPDRPYDSCDALFLEKKNIIAAIMLADCLPVVLYDRDRHCGMVCHAGWRGTAAGMARRAVEYFVRGGSQKENIVASVGPGIGPCCYTVGNEVAVEFQDRLIYPEDVVRDSGSGDFKLDLEMANLSQLRTCGIPEHQLGTSGICTACRSDEFYSYRKEQGHTGRHAAMMVLF